MDNNDLQTHLDRIGQWAIYDINWTHFHELALLDLVGLCALSVGLSPHYCQLVREVTTVDPKDPRTLRELKELAAYQNNSITEWERRVMVAVNHVIAGTLPVVRNAVPLGGQDPYESIPLDVEKIIVRVTDFVTWAVDSGWELPEEFSCSNARGGYPVAPEELQVGGGTKWPWGDYETELLRELAAAADHFWRLYDPTDGTTAPTNTQVIEWLESRGVAKRTAEVMATILRADGLPTGPRR